MLRLDKAVGSCHHVVPVNKRMTQNNLMSERSKYSFPLLIIAVFLLFRCNEQIRNAEGVIESKFEEADGLLMFMTS